MKNYSKLTDQELIKEFENLQTEKYRDYQMDASGDCGDMIEKAYKPQFEAIEEMEKREIFFCAGCGKLTANKENLMGFCEECEEEGYWMDPAGGVHHPNEGDPAAMYE